MSRESLLRSSPGGRMVSIPLSLSQDIQSFVSCSTFTFSRYPELCQLFHFHFLKISTLSICRSQDWDERRVPGGDAGVPRWRHCHLADPQNPGELSLFFKTIWNGTINKKDSHTLLAILPTAKSKDLTWKLWRDHIRVEVWTSISKTSKPCLWRSKDLFVQMSDAGTYTLRGENRNGSDKVFMSHLLLLGKLEYTGGPIFKVVLEC